MACPAQACNAKGASNPNYQSLVFDAVEHPCDLSGFTDKLDGLVYCPGTIKLKPLRGLKPEQFQDDFRINVLGAVQTLKANHALLKAGAAEGAKPGVVLFSTVAVQTGMAFHASIAASKGAVEGLVRTLAAEWAPDVRVNAVAPSLTDTSLAASLLGNDAKREASADRHPLKKVLVCGRSGLGCRIPGVCARGGHHRPGRAGGCRDGRGAMNDPTHMVRWTQKELDTWPSRKRARTVNSLSGFKSATLVGHGRSIWRTQFECGELGGAFGLKSSPNGHGPSAPRRRRPHLQEPLNATGQCTFNHIGVDWVTQGPPMQCTVPRPKCLSLKLWG